MSKDKTAFGWDDLAYELDISEELATLVKVTYTIAEGYSPKIPLPVFYSINDEEVYMSWYYEDVVFSIQVTPHEMRWHGWSPLGVKERGSGPVKVFTGQMYTWLQAVVDSPKVVESSGEYYQSSSPDTPKGA